MVLPTAIIRHTWTLDIGYRVKGLPTTRRTNMSCRFGRVEVVRDFRCDLDPGRRYIFGFHPHGLYPTGAGWLPLLPGFHAACPGIQPITLTASALYYPPVSYPPWHTAHL